MCPSGRTEIPITMNLPDNIQQSIYFKRVDLAKKIFYIFKVQVVPVFTSDVTDEYGGCSLSSSKKINVSPVRPIVTAPTFNNELFITKDCFLMKSKLCHAVITVPKSFYHTGETAFFNINIDNSLVPANCSLIV